VLLEVEAPVSVVWDAHPERKLDIKIKLRARRKKIGMEE